ncbi:TPA: hypothetical protein QHR34_002847 [Raoultella ornithinolytica]|uniref:DUF6414 family protein n=1 Tax=Klebsiella grimontii TaxID=2058152 RepID=UPI002378AD52|nr:hypothetical protein [Klebsiella grimontii]WDQ09604.1 hypothetical protein PVK07_15270 [Klebsiella grimontii]HDS8977637.1 hypothetical protein [Raoultella ornithinolytica]HDT1248701.1 hypothetical protein [Raoultella ornithinolytica]
MEQEQQSTDSLYDFLYVDNQRASSLLAQMHGPGVVTSIKHVTAEIDKSLSDAGFDLKILKSKIGVEETINQTQEKSFDASWTLPINLLDKLDENDLIRTELNGERLGSTVLCKGKMRIFDISVFQKSVPFIAKMMEMEQPKLPPKAKKTNFNVDEQFIAPGVTFGMMKEVLNIVPNTLQVDFINEAAQTIWMTINRDYLTINPDDMVLKYGSSLPGEWYVIGFIDALPEAEEDMMDTFTFEPNAMKDGITGMLSGIRDLAGRSSNSYGMTPLVIFRKIQ